MEKQDAITALGALAQDTRLDIFRLLVGVGPGGLPAGIIAERLGLPGATLSFHIKSLVQAGLVARRRERQSVIYRAEFQRMGELLDYLTVHCCDGRPELCRPLFVTPDEGGDIPMSDTEQCYNVLFLCTRNSARSLMAEAILNNLVQGPFRNLGRFRAYSAGSYPAAEPHPLALEILRRQNIPVDGLRSKPWDEFSGPGAPVMDFVFTVCDSAAAELCPVWPGQPLTAHWGVPDPAAVEGSELERIQAFRQAFRVLDNRIRIFTNLPIRSLDKLRLQRELDRIGGVREAQEGAA